VRRRRITRNPADLASPPSAKAAKAPEMHVWSGEELGRFLAFVNEDRLVALWRFLAMTGCRRGEALALRWSDLDFENGRVRIERALISIGYRLHVSEPKTERSRRTVSLDASTLTALRAHKARQATE